MIHGSMIEAKQGFATLEDVGLNTFLRFVQWLYHGYYDAAAPRSLASLETCQTPIRETRNAESCNYGGGSDYDGGSVACVEDYDGGSCQYCGRNSTYKVSDQAKERFVQRSYTVRNVTNGSPQPRPNSNKPADYSEVFLGHARLYVFADKYDVQNLKVLAMEELHATLAVYTLYQERTVDIVRLLRYVYANTAESKDGVEDLRTILIQYMEAEVDILIKDENLEELMLQDGGPLLADLMKVIREKLA